MKKFTQTILHDPENGKIGNCFATCVRCLLELEHEIPNFAEYTDWVTRTQLFLSTHDLAFIEMKIPKDDWCVNWIYSYHMIMGTSPRGVLHCVLGYNGEVVWDPHPSNAGLKEQDSYGFLIYRGWKR